MNAQECMQRIEERRSVMKPTKVEKGERPKWLPKRALRDDVFTQAINNGWAEHYGTTQYNGNTYFVCEPYDLSHNEMEAVETFASKYGLLWRLDANSWHYPGYTIRIVFWHK